MSAPLPLVLTFIVGAYVIRRSFQLGGVYTTSRVGQGSAVGLNPQYSHLVESAQTKGRSTRMHNDTEMLVQQTNEIQKAL